MDNEKIISESGNEGVNTETEFDPISAINDIKANTVSKEEYNKLKAEKDKYLKALIEDLIVKHSNEGDLICDCFSGSGTTAVASYNTNRNFVGCELSKEYYDKSLLRFEERGFDGRSDIDG